MEENQSCRCVGLDSLRLYQTDECISGTRHVMYPVMFR